MATQNKYQPKLSGYDRKKRNAKTFHVLNLAQELILKKLLEKERYIAYFTHCYETVRTLHALGYVNKRGGFQGSAIIVSISDKGIEYFARKEAKATKNLKEGPLF